MQRCFVAASRGLFNPSWEDGGTFALFLGGRPDVVVLTPQVLWSENGRACGVTRRVHALVDVECAPGVAPATGGRFMAQEAKMRALLTAHSADPIATVGDRRSCVQTWYAVESGGALVE